MIKDIEIKTTEETPKLTHVVTIGIGQLADGDLLIQWDPYHKLLGIIEEYAKNNGKWPEGLPFSEQLGASTLIYMQKFLNNTAARGVANDDIHNDDEGQADHHQQEEA